jgi:hypothetical protein
MQAAVETTLGAFRAARCLAVDFAKVGCVQHYWLHLS